MLAVSDNALIFLAKAGFSSVTIKLLRYYSCPVYTTGSAAQTAIVVVATPAAAPAAAAAPAVIGPGLNYNIRCSLTSRCFFYGN